jgi:hypothetical protein
MKCPICNFEGDFEEIKTYDQFSNDSELIRHQCKNCQLIFGSEKMLKLSSEELSKQYVELYKNYSECDTTNVQVEIFNKCFLKPGKYLNIGSGKTNLAKHLPNIDLYEYDPYTEKLHDKSINSLDEVIKIGPFDGIFTHNVLEHYQNPIEELKLHGSLLKDDGMIVHSTVCYDYECVNTRFHLFFYLGKSTEYLASRAGLKLVDLDKNYKGFIK